MTRPGRVAALALTSAAVLWLVIFAHQRRAHGRTALNEQEVVLGLTWMDSGKVLVVPLALLLVALTALHRSSPEPARLAFAGSAGALALVGAGTALQFWGFEWGSYEQSFEEASIGAGGALQAVGAPVLAVALTAFGVALAGRGVLPALAVPALPISALATYWLTPANPVPALAWLAVAGALAWRSTRGLPGPSAAPSGYRRSRAARFRRS